METLLNFFGVMGMQALLVMVYIAVLLLVKHLIVAIFMRKPAK